MSAGKKKTFKTGIESLIRTEEEREQDYKPVLMPTRKDKTTFAATSINTEPETIKLFKIALLKIEEPVYSFFEKSIDKIVVENKSVNIPQIKDEQSFSKYSFRMYRESRDKLKIYCTERDLNFRDVCVFLMKELIGIK
ncbi:MAG: hypothetical protein LBV43_06050 [Prevotella sp.]|jgi:hypothetical protein|nr:hypothetical protein [Prevotella sp.]